ncbi:sodium-dependent glucose transporter 1A-like protein [Cricetulus griseus]|uniref:Sodium-dependent glucose transporter 1A-like protein n=1 Tax=Cricetulus griseus TaxID=10029 RepID=A0A061IF86_CRIGR|nr:sodium-dependent glucose transporter 1A-like protein [Cricetulus griseus]
MSLAILGPTFQDLAENVNRNISSLSLIFVGRASGVLCGTMIGGVLFDHMNQYFLLGPVWKFRPHIGMSNVTILLWASNQLPNHDMKSF